MKEILKLKNGVTKMKILLYLIEKERKIKTENFEKIKKALTELEKEIKRIKIPS